MPQSTNLSLITAGDRYCVATKGWLTLQGGWLWRLKDHIDRAFMHKCGEATDRCTRLVTFVPDLFE